MKSSTKALAVCTALALCCAQALPASAESADSAQAKAKLAAVRARIAELTSRIALELKQRDVVERAPARGGSGDCREAPRGSIRCMPRSSAPSGAARACAPSRRAIESALQAERAALAAQVRAAYMIGPQEEIKLLLNQSDPRPSSDAC